MSRQPFLFCAGADCHERMPLPVPSPEKTSTDPPQWPTGAWSATVLHLGCGHLSVYTARELRWQSLARKLAPNRSGHERPAIAHEWRRVRLPCADPHCIVQTTVFAYLSSASSAQKLEHFPSYCKAPGQSLNQAWALLEVICFSASVMA